MKTFLTTAFVIAVSGVYAQIYMGETCKIAFFSETKLENIDAANTVAKPVLNSTTGDFAVRASQNAFMFKSSFMQEHYNENYMESETYPYATFTGKINETVDYHKNGTYNVTITGKLDMHGVSLPRTITGTITVKDQKLVLNAAFDVKVADHKIKVPALYSEKIAESVHVTFYAEMLPVKK